LHEGVSHRAGDGDETGDARAVLEAPPGNEGDATGDDEGERRPADEGGDGDGVSTGVVRVHEVGAPGADESPDAAGGREVPVGSHAHGAGGESGRAKSVEEGGVRLRHDERLVPAVALGAGEQEDLPLAAAPFATAVEVEEPELHGGGKLAGGEELGNAPAGESRPAPTVSRGTPSVGVVRSPPSSRRPLVIVRRETAGDAGRVLAVCECECQHHPNGEVRFARRSGASITK
jgi:hypothetical protein